MSRETKTEFIDGLEITVMQLPAKRALKLMHRLAKVLGPAALKAVGGDGLSLKNLATAKLGNLSEAASMIFDKFSESDLDQLLQDLFETARLGVNGKQLPMLTVMDDQLAGKPGALLSMIKFALEVNFGPFLSGFLASLAAQAPLRVEPESSSASPSVGQPTA